MKRFLKILAIAVALFIILGLDSRLQTTYYDYSSTKIPASFDGFCIVQLSDFHLKKFGKAESTLIQAINNCQPDLIVFPGDVVGENNGDICHPKDLRAGILPTDPI